MFKGCDACRKALRFLDSMDIEYSSIPIREQPPSRGELRQMLGYVDGDIRKLFNGSSATYRSLNLKEKMNRLTEGQKLDLLARHGNLVKRPFVIGDRLGLVGFKEDVWKAAFR